jgi:hypothetical protein
VQTTLEKIGATPVGSTSKEFDALMRAEAAKWEPVLKAANIRAQSILPASNTNPVVDTPMRNDFDTVASEG